MNIYVGNLPYRYSEEDLRAKFSSFGEVSSASIVKDKATGRSKGFGFVEMPDNAGGQAAIDGLASWEDLGRAIKVNEAKPREERSGGGGGGGGYRPSGGGGGGDRDRKFGRPRS